MQPKSLEYTELQAKIAEMGIHVSTMIENSMQALVDQNDALAKKTIKLDTLVDRLDVEIDTLCTKIIALFNPKATDLRYIMTASKIIVDLERIGDHSCNISREVLKINKAPLIKPYVDLPGMGKLAIEMIKKAVNAYFDRNVAVAQQVIQTDVKINDLHRSVLHKLMALTRSNPDATESAISLMFITRSVERVADHAKNIAELVHFMVTGQIIRHIKKIS
jgi:phosphate transport system protein